MFLNARLSLATCWLLVLQWSKALVPLWYTAGKYVVSLWYIAGQYAVLLWYIAGQYVVPVCYIAGQYVVPLWYVAGQTICEKKIGYIREGEVNALIDLAAKTGGLLLLERITSVEWPLRAGPP